MQVNTITTGLVLAPKAKKKPNNASLVRNLRLFMEHNKLPNSHNVLNDHSIFNHAPVVAEGWMSLPAKLYCHVNPRRDVTVDNMVHISKFDQILQAVGYDKESPICLDRKGRVLDGAYRLYVMGKLAEKHGGHRVYVKVYDFE